MIEYCLWWMCRFTMTFKAFWALWFSKYCTLYMQFYSIVCSDTYASSFLSQNSIYAWFHNDARLNQQSMLYILPYFPVMSQVYIWAWYGFRSVSKHCYKNYSNWALSGTATYVCTVAELNWANDIYIRVNLSTEWQVQPWNIVWRTYESKKTTSGTKCYGTKPCVLSKMSFFFGGSYFRVLTVLIPVFKLVIIFCIFNLIQFSWWRSTDRNVDVSLLWKADLFSFHLQNLAPSIYFWDFTAMT